LGRRDGRAAGHLAQGQPARLTPFADRLLWAETRARTRLTPHIEALRAELERVLAEALDGSQHVLTIFASHDLALPHLRDLASQARACISNCALPAASTRWRRWPRAVAWSPVSTCHRWKAARRSSPARMKPLLKPGRHKLIGCLRRTQG